MLKRVVVMESGVHGKKHPVVVFETEIARLLADLVKQPVVARTARIHVVISAQGIDRDVVAEERLTDVEEIDLRLALCPRVVTISKMQENFGV
jgi:hypothetical protein